MATLFDIYAEMRKMGRDAGSQRAWAAKHDVSPQYISDVLNGRKPPGPKILKPLGYRAITVYERIVEE